MRDLALDAVVGHLPKVARSIESGYLELSSWLEAHLPRISTLITATILSFYGRVVTDRTRQLAQDWPFILRLALFVSVGLGFSLLIASASPLIAAGLKLAGTPYLVPAVFGAFLVIGILAERNGRI